MIPRRDAILLALLCERPQATAVEIGKACRMTPGEVRARLASLESQRLIVGRHDASLMPPARVFAVTGEGRRKAGVSDARTTLPRDNAEA